MSPEQRLQQPTGPATDVWGMGCLLLMLRCPGVLWLLPETYQQGQRWDVTQLLASSACQHLAAAEKCFAQQCLQLQPAQRATMDELLQSPYLKEGIMDSNLTTATGDVSISLDALSFDMLLAAAAANMGEL